MFSNNELTDIWLFLWKTAVWGQFSRVNSSQIQVWRIHYLKTYRGRGGRMMDGPINHWWRQDRDRFLVQEGIMSNEFKLTIHKAIKISEPPVWSFPVSLYKYTISSHTFWIKQFYHQDSYFWAKHVLFSCRYQELLNT
jgi:hypothetical protein